MSAVKASHAKPGLSSSRAGWRAALRRMWATGIMVRVTNMGLGFILMTLLVAIGATNTGNNGLYVLVSLFLSALIVSGLVSRRNVDRIEASLVGPQEIFAGEAARFTLRLTNTGRLPRRALLVKISGASAPLLFGQIGSRETAGRSVDLVFPRRGRRTVDSLLIYSAYPIGLFRKGRLHLVDEERIVFPVPVAPPSSLRGRQSTDAGESRDRRRGQASEILHLREGMEGASPRDIHWPQTARQERVILKERAAEAGRDTQILLDGRRPENAPPDWNEAFERAVSEVAGLSLRLLSEGGRVGLSFVGGGFLPPGRGPQQRRAILTSLALAEPVDVSGPEPRLPRSMAAVWIRPGRSDRAETTAA